MCPDQGGRHPPFLQLLESGDQASQGKAALALTRLPCDLEALPLNNSVRGLSLKLKLRHAAREPEQNHHTPCNICGVEVQGPLYECKDCPVPPGLNLCGRCMVITGVNPDERDVKQHEASHRVKLVVTAMHCAKVLSGVIPRQTLVRWLKQAVLQDSLPAGARDTASPGLGAPAFGSMDSPTAVFSGLSLSSSLSAGPTSSAPGLGAHGSPAAAPDGNSTNPTAQQPVQQHPTGLASPGH